MPVAPPPDAELPRCTVIVPAYNEGAMVRVALVSALENDYPADKLYDNLWVIRLAPDGRATRFTEWYMERDR